MPSPPRATRTTRGSEDNTMAQFAADIAGMLELFAIAAGLVLLHRAGKEAQRCCSRPLVGCSW